jgi:hypothetical protein
MAAHRRVQKIPVVRVESPCSWSGRGATRWPKVPEGVWLRARCLKSAIVWQGSKASLSVDKLLTGFDAPPATYLYIDKQMQDHGLFQAICRVNRLDGDDKEYGYIINEMAVYPKYYEKMSELLDELIGVEVAHCGIKRMKTRWGTCNIEAKRIWLNLELAKKPPACLEYILVHEMVHLLERHHNDRFRAYMDQFLPQWRLHREELNRAPLAHEDWEY